jgi:hypothetical protein
MGKASIFQQPLKIKMSPWRQPALLSVRKPREQAGEQNAWKTLHSVSSVQKGVCLYALATSFKKECILYLLNSEQKATLGRHDSFLCVHGLTNVFSVLTFVFLFS